ncbi:Uncharacterised protein [Klebsiella oxytoca]|nr:Uncharacterised protein [Klebsiella oxytoca]
MSFLHPFIDYHDRCICADSMVERHKNSCLKCQKLCLTVAFSCGASVYN